jgi:RNA polymerase sigma factor (sigma-70 family)
MITNEMPPPTVRGDDDLVAASLGGDRDAFGQIVRRHQALVCSLAYSATGSLTQSEDLAQETFIAAWKHLGDLREPVKLRSWLCGIARNLIRNSLRKQGREPSHRAEALENIAEPRSPEPLPGERAISREEAEIMWRALERIPETYREPLVLFYRQHQSVETVAQELELTEEAVRQRLARGRRLLQEEVLAFVEGALEKTAPGTVFTLAVVAALPFAVTSAKAASIGVAVAKGGAGAKSIFSLAALCSLAAMLGAILFSWKTAVDETKSPPERRLMVRTAWFQIAFFVLSMGATFYGLPRLMQHPLALGIGFALLLFANVVNGVLLLHYLNRRRTEIVMEEGTWADTDWSGPGKETDRRAIRKSIKIMIPILMLFVIGGIGMPWKQHWVRSAAVVAAEGLVLVWGFRRYQGMLSFRFAPAAKTSRVPTFLRHPIISLPAILFGSAALAGGLVFYFNPGSAEVLIHRGPWLRNMGLSFLAAIAAYAVFAVIFVKKRGITLGTAGDVGETDGPFPGQPGGNVISRIFGNTVLNKTFGMTMKLMGPMMVKAYAPVFEQINLGPDQRAQLNDLILKKNDVNMNKGLELMHRGLDATRRAALIEEMKSGREGCDTEIRRLLGEEDYQVFEQFEKGLPDRLVIGMFKIKSARTGEALSEEQCEQMIQAVGTARAQYPWSTDLSRRIQNPADPVATYSEENIAIFAREEEAFERQFLTETILPLTAEQLVAFEPFLAKQRKAKIAAMKMTAKMFTPGGS